MSISIDELLRDKSISKLVNRIATPLSLFQRSMNMGIGSTPSIQSNDRTAVWDIFDSTRRVAGGAAPMTGPRRVQPQAIGQGYAQCMRLHESVLLLDEKVFRTRPLGAPVGTVDQTGVNYITKQISYLTQRFTNTREFMVSRLFYGGFDLTVDGAGNYRPVEAGSGQIQIRTQTPASHFTQLALGASSADLITATWSNANTDIAAQLNNVNATMNRVYGLPLRHIWINTGVYNYLLNNSKLQSQGGSVYRPFDSIVARDNVKNTEGMPDTGFDVVFRACPLYRFHVYDGVLNLNDSTGSSLSADDVTLLVKNNTAIMHPEIGDWAGWIAGAEPVRKNLAQASSQIVQGFYGWATPTIDPAGQELKFLDNGLPFLSVPRAIMTPTVVF